VIEPSGLGRTAIIIAVSYGILGGLVVLVIGAVVWSSTVAGRRQIDARKLGEREKTWFAVVVVLLVALLFGTIFFTPYGRGSAGRHGKRVDVTAEQFAFLMPGAKVRVGEPVEFHLTSKDVSHGFAVFTAKRKFLFQVQVLPGTTQLYRYTFHKPGLYTVECFEYCGLGHDAMRGTITVTP
jgi:cytochrome c oxidase subunit 2